MEDNRYMAAVASYDNGAGELFCTAMTGSTENELLDSLNAFFADEAREAESDDVVLFTDLKYADGSGASVGDTDYRIAIIVPRKPE